VLCCADLKKPGTIAHIWARSPVTAPDHHETIIHSLVTTRPPCPLACLSAFCFCASLPLKVLHNHTSSHFSNYQVGSWYQTFKREYASVKGNRCNQGSFTARKTVHGQLITWRYSKSTVPSLPAPLLRPPPPPRHHPLHTCNNQVGSWYQTFKREYAAVTGNRWNQGSFTAIYRNSDRPSTQWFHDNT
jgi:hypothetical protein